jgi:hypothetical protein
MLEQLIGQVPGAWRELVELLLAPVIWIPRMQRVLLSYFLHSSSPWTAVAKYVFAFFPVLLGVAALWCTQLSLYTLPFREARGRFVSLMLLAWWDVARAVWLYWVGIVRLAGVAVGWGLALAHLVLRLGAGLVKQVVVTPLALTGSMTRSYLQPGVPWVAFALLVSWCAVEAAIFAYILHPMVSEILANLVGSDEHLRLTGPMLYGLLVLLVMGSFACLQVLSDAVRRRESRYLAQVAVVELLVMVVEVMFLYREMVASMMPWVLTEAGPRTGLALAISLGAFSWLGVRAMAWFLFGQYGTPPLMALISRQPLAHAGTSEPPSTRLAPGAWWRAATADFKAEVDWLHERSDQFLEYLALPVLHLLGAAFNIAMILTSGRPVFSLPFRGLKEVTETRDLVATLQLQPRKQAAP